MRVVGGAVCTLVIVEAGKGTALTVSYLVEVDTTVVGGDDSVLYDTTVDVTVVG